MPPEFKPGRAQPFAYDHGLYDRQFMSCLYRHAVVWLERLGRPVRLLFYNALPTSDLVLAQMLVERRPKFAFRCDTFSDADFESIGATETAVMAESFADIRPRLLERVQAREFALVEGNVYYLPHCPEYRKANNQHVVVVHGLEADGRWQITDDDATSILRGYVYDEGYLARFFDHSVNRKLRCFDIDHGRSTADALALIEPKFRSFVASYRDSGQFFDAVGDFLHSPFDTAQQKHQLLHDAFAILSGSRQCFAAYLEARGSRATLVEAAAACAKAANTLKMIMARAKLGGALNEGDLLDRVVQLRQHEDFLQQRLQAEAFDIPAR